jgi:hypothetical protein
VTIIRTQHSSNFTITPNTVINESTLSLEAFGVWAYLISKPKTWNFNAGAIKRKFGIGLNKVYRIMRELIQAGYAFYKRTQSACEWFIYDTPQNIKTTTAPAVIDRVNFEHVKNECVLERNELLERNEKTTTPEPLKQPDPVKPVVVSCEEEKLKFPATFTKDQKSDAKHALKKVNNPALRQDVLSVLAHYMINSHIKSIPAYLNDLINRANNGKLGTIPNAGDTKTVNRSIELANKELELRRKPAKITDDGRKKGMAGIKGLFGGYQTA